MTIVINGTTGISGVDGSAGTPAVQGTDTNTGVFYPAADTVGVSTGGSERMRIDSSGNVGIGTSSPTATLQVSKTSGDNLITSGSTYPVTIYTNNAAADPAIYWKAATGALRFGNTTDGIGTSGFTERMRMDSSGRLLLATTTTVDANAFMSIRNVNGTTGGIGIGNSVGSSDTNCITFFNSNGQVGRINTSGGATGYVTSSDYRLKEDIAPMTGALNKVVQLKPVTYKWKADGSLSEGFIAHELQTVVPDCVFGEKDAVDADGNPIYQGIDTSFLVATLTAAIQEQQALITSLTTRIETLETK